MGSDYVAITRDIIFNEETDYTQIVYVPIKNDECLEYNETFSVTVSSNMSCVIIVTGEVNITIDDDDSEFCLMVAALRYTLQRGMYSIT